MSSYAAIRNAQRAKNLSLLTSIKLDLMPQAPPGPNITTLSQPKPVVTKVKKPAAAKRRRAASSDASSSPSRPAGVRSSARTRKAISRFADEKYTDDEGEDSDEWDSSEAEDEDAERSGGAKKRKSSSGIPQRLSGARPDPKVFGHQRGTEVGQWWASRMEASQAGIHAPPVGGIAGNAQDGVFSVALSGGYAEDIDLGNAFTYTGSGGRDLSTKNLRTAPQTFDQSFTGLNAALKRSVDHRKPVRVLRGFKNPSPFAPKTGYSYSGLYLVTKAWLDVGESGFKVTRFSFVRMAGQPALAVQEGREEEAAQILAEFDGNNGADSASSSPASVLKAVTPQKVASKKVGAEEHTPEEPRKIRALPMRTSPRTPVK